MAAIAFGCAASGLDPETVLGGTMLVNAGEVLFVTLGFVNFEQDTFVEIVLNDSQAGPDQVYSTVAFQDKAIRVDTTWNADDSTYLTEIDPMPND